MLNIGSDHEISIKDLVNKLVNVVNYEGEIVFNSDYPDGNPRKLLDSSKIFNYGWKPEVDIDKGLELTYNWYKENIY